MRSARRRGGLIYRPRRTSSVNGGADVLDRLVQAERQTATDELLRYYEQYHRHAVLVPSGRFGLYAAAREMLSPGDGVIVSPITCRTVIHALLAAKLVPVFVDIELETGNIDIGKLPGTSLNRVQAIVTTNLYGNPDRAPELAKIARAHNLLLIEDCAHVLHTSIDRRPIGSIGDVSVFSFKKYFDEPGGVVVLRDEDAARKLRARLAVESSMPPQAEERRRYAQFILTRAASPAAVRPLSALYRRLHGAAGSAGSLPGTQEPNGNSAPLEPALQSLPPTASLLRVASLLHRREQIISDRMAAAGDLIEHCPLPVKRSGYADDVCYLAVPFFSTRRDEIVAAMEQRGIPTYFRYTPPMNEVFKSELSSACSLDREAISYWCGNILPVNPRYRRQYLETIETLNR